MALQTGAKALALSCGLDFLLFKAWRLTAACLFPVWLFLHHGQDISDILLVYYYTIAFIFSVLKNSNNIPVGVLRVNPLADDREPARPQVHIQRCVYKWKWFIFNLCLLVHSAVTTTVEKRCVKVQEND